MTVIVLSLFPLGTVLFPDGALPLQIFEPRYLALIGKCDADGSPFGVVMLTEGAEVRTPQGGERFAAFGTLAAVQESRAAGPGLLHVLCRGAARFRLVSQLRQADGLWTGQAELVADDRAVRIPSELQGAADALAPVLAALHAVPPQRWPVLPPFRLDDCGWVANRWCELLPLAKPLKQHLLMLDNPLIRLELVHDVLDEHGLLRS